MECGDGDGGKLQQGCEAVVGGVITPWVAFLAKYAWVGGLIIESSNIAIAENGSPPIRSMAGARNAAS